MGDRDVPLCIDTRMISKGATGVSTYARALVTAAKATGRPTMLLDAEHENDGFVRKWLAAALVQDQVLELRCVPGEHRQLHLAGRDIFRRAHVHFTIRRRFMALTPPVPFGIMHWTYPVPLRMRGWLNIYTLHDLIPLLHPRLSSISAGRHRAILRELSVHADRIVTVSESARSEIVSHVDFAPDRVFDCGQGVETCPADTPPITPFGLSRGGYFLFCGVVEPRKNLRRLIKAHHASGVRLPLVVAGPDGWSAQALNALVSRSPGVLRLGYLPRDVLLVLMRDARALVFPSLAEGFGLPVIEAMQLGTPVLTSARGALAEVAGSAALLVDPEDEQAMAASLRALEKDDALTDELARRGTVRARFFSPDRFARRVAAVYDGALDAYRQHGAVSDAAARSSSRGSVQFQ